MNMANILFTFHSLFIRTPAPSQPGLIRTGFSTSGENVHIQTWKHSVSPGIKGGAFVLQYFQICGEKWRSSMLNWLVKTSGQIRDWGSGLQFLLLVGGHGNFKWKIFKLWHFQLYRMEAEHPKGWGGIPGGFLGDSRRWSGLGRAHWLFLRLQKMVVWVSSVGLCLLLPLWEMNVFEKWVRATDHLSRKACGVHRTMYHTYILFYV